MGNLKIGNRQPSVGSLKQGNANVAKIYKGDELVWPLGGEADNYEPLSDDNVRFVGLYDKKLITYFTNVQTPFPFDPQYIDQETSYTGMEFRILEQITAISDNMEYIYARSRTSSNTTYLTYIFLVTNGQKRLKTVIFFFLNNLEVNSIKPPNTSINIPEKRLTL